MIFYATNSIRKGIILLESRGYKEDSILLKHINPKWQDNYHTTTVGLEIADLFSYPIHKFLKLEKKDKAFKIIENKIIGYPEYLNKGLKVFPSRKKLK